MAMEIDQSGKVEQLDTNTVIAFSNTHSGAINCKTTTKIIIYKYLRRSLIPSQDLPAIIFATLVYILISQTKETVVWIDEEYTGKDKIIRETIEKLFRRNGRRKIPDIRFKQVGKQSEAHHLAWATHRNKKRSLARNVFDIEILKLLERN